jgi:hypothetical protein
MCTAVYTLRNMGKTILANFDEASWANEVLILEILLYCQHLNWNLVLTFPRQFSASNPKY